MPSFQRWVKAMPAEQEYDYQQPTKCAFAQFLKSQGYPNPVVLVSSFVLHNSTTAWHRYRYDYPQDLAQAIMGPATFGALSERLDVYFTEHPHKLPVLTSGML
jgi:hypothetical protein